MTERPSRSTRNKRWRGLLIVIAALLIVRIILPYVLLHFANDRLKKVKGYYGHIADLDLAIIRGAYKLEGFYLDRKDTVTEERTLSECRCDRPFRGMACALPWQHRGRTGGGHSGGPFYEGGGW